VRQDEIGYSSNERGLKGEKNKMKKSLSGLIVGLVLALSAFAATEDLGLNSQALEQLKTLRKTLADPNAPKQGPIPAAPGTLGAPGAHGAPTPMANAPMAPRPMMEQARPSDSSMTVAELASGGSDEAVDEAAFRAAMQTKYPLTPEQILRIRQKFNLTKLAIDTPPTAPPRPVATSQFVNLSPGTTPPVIRLSQGFVSSLVFLDSTGAPWPIAAYDLGNPSAFNIQWDKTSNTMMIQATKMYTFGNLAIRLRKLNTPVMLTLVPGQKAVDYRVDLRIQGYGPNALAIPTGDSLPPTEHDALLSLLDGVAPAGSTELQALGGNAQIWVQANMMFVRTRLNLLSPGWISTMSSADGMRVYKMTRAPVLLVSDRGKLKQLRIEGL